LSVEPERRGMATIDAGDLFPNDRTLEAVAAGEMTQIHRGQRYAEEGDTFELDGDTFEVVDVTERTLGDMTDEDARREGSADLESYKERMVRAHGGEFEWDDEADVVRHRVARTEE
jgi:kynureninase